MPKGGDLPGTLKCPSAPAFRNPASTRLQPSPLRVHSPLTLRAAQAPPPARGTARPAHQGNSMWTLRLPPAPAATALVDISRWSFLPRKTLQSEAMATTYQRPENCEELGDQLARGPGHKADTPDRDSSEATRRVSERSVHLLGLRLGWTRALCCTYGGRSHHHWEPPYPTGKWVSNHPHRVVSGLHREQV